MTLQLDSWHGRGNGPDWMATGRAFPAADTGRHSCRLGAISRRGVKKGPGNPISLVSADPAVAAGPAAHATPSKSRGPAARTARRALPGRDRRAAVRHGRRAARGSACRSASGRTPRSRAAPRPGPGCVRAPRARAGRGPDAAQIITAFSRPGELVVIPGARDGALLAAAAAAGRRVLGLAPGPARLPAGPGGPGPGLDPGAAPARRGPAPAARPCSWRPAARRPGRRPWPSPGRRAAPGLPR